MGATPKRKLIEVSLPLEAINKASAREKSIRHGHPSTLHLWWSRKPLATARAVLFAQLVDDPSSHPEKFPTEELQAKERKRLHDIIERLVVWEYSNDQNLLDEAHQEILDSTDNNPPPVLDPFCGGGTIPLEAQRLGLEAHGSDLNPVAVLITKALIEFPPKFRDRPAIHPDHAGKATDSWTGAAGLAADVRSYGEWMRDEAARRIGKHYPQATLEDGSKADVIAWIWARTVTCPNPGCGIEMPLTSKWWLSKKKGKETFLVPSVVADRKHPSRKRVTYDIAYGPDGPTKEDDGTMSGRTGGVCIACGSAVDKAYVKAEGTEGRMAASLMAVVAEGNRSRVYLHSDQLHMKAAHVERLSNLPTQELGHDPRNLWTPQYGLKKFTDLFTNRQLLALTTFSDLVSEARERAFTDAKASGMRVGKRLEQGGTDAAAYADTIAVYLALALSRMSDRCSSISSWDVTRESSRNTFARQAIPMTWDYVETNPLSSHSGGYSGQLNYISKALGALPRNMFGFAEQRDAVSSRVDGLALSTDPPYYDNIGYSDLSDYFYVWLRSAIGGVLPNLFSTLLVPKESEMVANPYRHNGKPKAREYFERKFQRVFEQIRSSQWPDLPVTVYYAFKQSDDDEIGIGAGWQTMLTSMVNARWSITATWPMRSELSNRMLASGTNSLASSIVLVLRPREIDAPVIDRRGFLSTLRAELVPALNHMQEASIAPVDLPQAAIGPGMQVFTRYSKVLNAKGEPMTVNEALRLINEVLDEVMNQQEQDFDQVTSFALTWYRQHGYNAATFGAADNVARAKNVAVETLARHGILTSKAGKVQLLSPKHLPAQYDVTADDHISVWEVLHHAIRTLDEDGIAPTAELLAAARDRRQGAVDPGLVRELAFQLFRIADQNSASQDATKFNDLVTTWPDIADILSVTGVASPVVSPNPPHKPTRSVSQRRTMRNKTATRASR